MTTTQITIEDEKVYGAVVINVIVFETEPKWRERKYEGITQSSCDRLINLLDTPIVELDAVNGISLSFIYKRNK